MRLTIAVFVEQRERLFELRDLLLCQVPLPR